jgi:TonB family protein
MKTDKNRLMTALIFSLLFHFGFILCFTDLPPSVTMSESASGVEIAYGFSADSGTTGQPDFSPSTAADAGEDSAIKQEENPSPARMGTEAAFVDKNNAASRGDGRGDPDRLGATPSLKYNQARAAFLKQLAANQLYPLQAREDNTEGTVGLAISLDREGKPVSIGITQSSGFTVLDNAAVSLVRRSLPFAHGLNSPFTVSLTISYRLKDTK